MPDTTVSTSFARLTVVAGGHRRDVIVPTDAPVAQLTADLRRQLDGGNGLRLAPLRLARPGRPDLAPHRPLREQDVREGEVLYLLPGHASSPMPVVDDVVEAVAVRADGTAGTVWTGRTHRAALLTGAVALLTVAAVLLPRLGSSGQTLAAGVAVAVGLLGAAVSLTRRGDGAAATAAGLSALPWWAAGGWLLAGDRSDAVRVAAAGAAGAIGAVLAGMSVPAVAAAAGGVVAAAVSLAGAAAAVATGWLTLVQGAAVLTVTWAVILAVVPAIASRLAGLLPLAAQAEVGSGAVLESIRRATLARSLVTWLHGLGAVVLAAAGTALALAGGPADRGLAAVVAVLVAVRARRSKYRVDRIPALCTAGVVLAALSWAVTGDAGTGPAWAVAAVALLGGGLLAGAATWQDRPLSARTASRLDLLDNVVALSVLPLLAGSLGLFGLVDRLARG